MSTLRAMLDSERERHEGIAAELRSQLEELKASSAPMAVSARQLPVLMDSLEVCQRERRLALVEASKESRACSVALGMTLRELEDELHAVSASAASASASADELRKAEMAEMRRELASSRKKASARPARAQAQTAPKPSLLSPLSL